MRGIALTALLVCLGVGCAPSDDGSSAPPATSETATEPAGTTASPPATPPDMPPVSPLDQTALPTLTPPAEPPKTPTDQSGPITVAGTIEQGVESGCVVLVGADSAVSYVLTGRLPVDIGFGTTAKVRGIPQPDMQSLCNQGIVLHVIEVLPP